MPTHKPYPKSKKPNAGSANKMAKKGKKAGPVLQRGKAKKGKGGKTPGY